MALQYKSNANIMTTSESIFADKDDVGVNAVLLAVQLWLKSKVVTDRIKRYKMTDTIFDVPLKDWGSYQYLEFIITYVIQ